MANSEGASKFSATPGPAGQEKPVGLGAYIALLLVICFFSGIMSGLENGWAIFDYTRLLGQFGLMDDQGSNFVGQGGGGARHGFLFALSMIPSVMLALGVMAVAECFGAIEAARRLLTPLMRPLLGLPGEAGLALITSLQSSDGGGAMTRDLYDAGRLTDRERSLMGAFQFSSGSSITVYLTGSAAFISALEVSYLMPLIVILFYKVVGTNLMRLYLTLTMKKDDSPETGRAE